MTRRNLLTAVGLTGVAASPLLAQTTQPAAPAAPVPSGQVPPPNPDSIVKNYGGANDPQRSAPLLCVLSSNMAKVPWPELGNIAQQLGFDGVDLTCYKGGHVEPEMIAVDLVRAFEVVRGAGISVPVVTTHITNLAEPNAFGIIALSGNAGVPVYRTGLWKYGSRPNLQARMQEIRRDVMQLIMGGRRYTIAAAIPNRVGGNFGGALFDIQAVIADLEPQSAGYFFDVAQAVAVGPNDDWITAFHLAQPRLKAVSISDFAWVSKGKEMTMQPCPLGEGVVDWQRFFTLLAQARYMGPVSIEMAYKSGSEVNAMQKDLEFARKQLGQAYGVGPAKS